MDWPIDRGNVVSGVLADLRQAARLLARERGFTVVALLTLGLGVGACTAMFSIVDRLLIRPLPFPSPDRLVRVTVDHEGRRVQDVGLSAQELLDLAERADLFSGVSGLYPINVNLTGADEPERIEMQLVSVGFFDLLGVSAQTGRVFQAGDYQPGIAEVAVISDGLWNRRFGRDPSVLGRKVRLDNDLFTIVGVMPRGFHQPSRGLSGDAELWAPAGYRATPFGPPVRAVNFLAGAVGRLRDGLSVSAVQTELDRLSADLVRAYPDAYPAALGWRLRAVPLKDDVVGTLRPALTLLMGAVLLVLLIGCANLANLLLVRADARVPEVRVRLALGASTGRIVRQSLVESGLVSLIGAGGGLLTAGWALDALVALSPVDLRALGAGEIDSRAALFAAAVAVTCTVLFGLAPAWRSSRVSLATSTNGRVTGDTPAARRSRDLLVVGQSAVALMLLVGALLVLRSVGALLDVSAGFDPTGVTLARFWMPQPNDPASGPYFRHEQRLPFFRGLLERVEALPGVASAGYTSAVSLVDRRALQGILIEGRPVESVDSVTAQTTLASPGYFTAMRIGLVRGRALLESDDERAPAVAVINESFARKFFEGEDPIGRRIRPGNRQSTAPWLTIVGVVRDVRSDGLDREAPAQLYRALYQASTLQFAMVVRASGDAASLGRAITREVRALDADLPVFGVRPLTDVVEQSIGQRRLAMQLLGVFAGAAVLLAGIGLYGVMSYHVGLRRRELGVRLAVGATPFALARMVLARGAAVTAVGIGVGLAAARALSRVMQTLLFGLTPLDGPTYVASALLLGLVGVIACWLPARRAAATDPMRTLRAE